METILVADYTSDRTFDIYDAEAGYHFLLGLLLYGFVSLSE
jgi:hypothetical protein